MALDESQRIAKVIRYFPLAHGCLCTITCNPFNSSWEMSVWTKVVGWPTYTATIVTHIYTYYLRNDDNKDCFSFLLMHMCFWNYTVKCFHHISVVPDISYIVDMTRCRQSAGLELGLHHPTQHLFPWSVTLPLVNDITIQAEGVKWRFSPWSANWKTHSFRGHG